MPSGNQDDAVVVDVGAGRPGDDEITGGFEETIGVVMIQQRDCVYVFARCACQRIRRQQRPCVVFGAVDAVGIAGQRVHVGCAIQIQRQ